MAIEVAVNDKNSEGLELDEDEKEEIRRKETYKQITITFYGP